MIEFFGHCIFGYFVHCIWYLKVRAVKAGLMMKSPLPLKKRVVLSPPTSDAVRDEARFYQYRREKEEQKQVDEEDKENQPDYGEGKNKEVEDGEWDGEEEKSSPRSWDFRNRSGLTEEVQ